MAESKETSTDRAPGATPRIALRGIRKVYPAVVANDGVDLTVMPGELHAVLGENGAGKSTLMKVIYGAVRPDAGTMHWNGDAVHLRNPNDARALGIAMVYQHFSLFESLTVAQNIALGLDRSLTLAQITGRVVTKAREYGLDLEPQRPVHTLSVGERQRVEVMRALLTEPKLLILDEPTSVLTPQAIDKLFETLRLLARAGCSILYISHKLDEIRALCERCTVMRAGRVTGVVDPRNETTAGLSRLMIGAEPPRVERAAGERGAIALRVAGLSLAKRDEFGVDLRQVSLDVHRGEIVGIAGVSGNGQAELLDALAGEDRRAPSGAVVLFGESVGTAGASARRERGLHFVPEERLGRGAVPALSLAENVLLTRRTAGVVRKLGWIDTSRTRSMAAGIIERFNVKAGGASAAARSLSGGNLQKFIVGREIDAVPKVLIVAQPTWGVDVGAAAQIHAALLALRASGCAVLVVSEDLEELFTLTDRLYVVAAGRLSPSVDTAQATVERIGEWMSGLWDATTGAPHAT